MRRNCCHLLSMTCRAVLQVIVLPDTPALSLPKPIICLTMTCLTCCEEKNTHLASCRLSSSTSWKAESHLRLVKTEMSQMPPDGVVVKPRSRPSLLKFFATSMVLSLTEAQIPSLQSWTRNLCRRGKTHPNGFP